MEKTLRIENKDYSYYSLEGFERLPYSLKILLENDLRHGGKNRDLFVKWMKEGRADEEVNFFPARVLMQDFTGVPAIVDLAAMRDALKGGDPSQINPSIPVDLVIDHSVIVDHFGTSSAFKENVEIEFERNRERYAFLKWGQQSFKNFRVVPPGTGICHQVNLEYLAQGVWTKEENGKTWAYPDTLVGTDSHTTMINGLGVLGWGVGGIEAEAAMLGQPLSMLLPDVIGFRLTGKLPEGSTATDLVLTITHILRKKGVVGKFVEFFGPGLSALNVADRATIANMAPEYGATCGLFPIDQETLDYLTFTGRNPTLVEAYAKAQGFWNQDNTIYTDIVELDMGTIEPTLAGPKRPQDQLPLKTAKEASLKALGDLTPSKNELGHGSVVIAAITSCTNTSNPSVMIAAGLLAQKAHARGLKVKPWVKTSLAPGSQVVTDYLTQAGLMPALESLGFNLVGYGCTTCIGNSGPLPADIANSIEKQDLTVAAVLSGNRNFEGRVHPQVKLNYLASPPLVVAYALAGTMALDLLTEPLGQDVQGKNVFLKDLWPTQAEINQALKASLTPEMFKERYRDVFKGDTLWQSISVTPSLTYSWQESTYIKHPPYFHLKNLPTLKDARILALLGDSVTTDHISPAGSIKQNSPAGLYLQNRQVTPQEFNSYGSRRGNHDIMMRGTFANIRLQNEMLQNVTGGYTKLFPEGTQLSIFDAAMAYQEQGTPLVIIAGKEYGTGSSRDWAAKGTRLLGVSAVIAESFERIHRSNLVGMGVLPLVFTQGDTRKTLGLTGEERITLQWNELSPKMEIPATITYGNGQEKTIQLLCRIDTAEEISAFQNGGILPYVLRRFG